MKKVSHCKVSWTNNYGFALRVIVLGLYISLTACAKIVHVPVEERRQPPAEKINLHRVSAGETLYSIAWRYTLDPSELAALNQLSKPYQLKIGQNLSLDRRLTQNKKTNTQLAANRDTSNKPITTSTAPSGSTAKATWVWPTQGKIARSFQAKAVVHKGIDIVGRSGQPVLAAEDGVVVYAGNGLSAYGNLIIVKHRDHLLSAYAHNKRLLAAEGDRVKAGEKIAEMGRSGTSKEHLHFEIRKNGHPIDPLRVLPKRAS